MKIRVFDSQDEYASFLKNGHNGEACFGFKIERVGRIAIDTKSEKSIKKCLTEGNRPMQELPMDLYLWVDPVDIDKAIRNRFKSKKK